MTTARRSESRQRLLDLLLEEATAMMLELAADDRSPVDSQVAEALRGDMTATVDGMSDATVEELLADPKITREMFHERLGPMVRKAIASRRPS